MYNHAPGKYICPFCLMIHGIENERVDSVQSDIIYHNQTVTTLISSHQWPNNHGNVIIVPNEHFENIYDLPIHCATEIHKAAQMIAVAMKAVYACDGISTRQHNEPAGGQDVWHYHLHITPRFKGDLFYLNLFRKSRMPVRERAKHAQRLESYLAKYQVPASSKGI